MVSVLCGFGKRLHESYVFMFLMINWGMYFGNRRGENSGNPCRFWVVFNFASSQLRVKTMMKTWFLEVNSEAYVDQFWWKSLPFFNKFAFRKWHDFLWHVRLQRFLAKSKMSVLLYTCCKNWWFPWLSERIRRWNIEYLKGRRAKVDDFHWNLGPGVTNL